MAQNENIFVSHMMEKMQKQMNLPSHAYFFDKTLRDGEQTYGIVFNLDEKLEIVRSLDNLGVDAHLGIGPLRSQKHNRNKK